MNDKGEIDATEFGHRGLLEWAGKDTEPEITALGRQAAMALLEEDRVLRTRLRGSSAAKNYVKEAAGLTYWLYETTLVYFVFRAWAAHHHVIWDWEGPGEKSPSGRSAQQIDLVVHFDDRRSLGFEAKRWNTKKDTVDMIYDSKKLNEWKSESSAARNEGYLMALWWTDSGRLLKDQADVRMFATDERPLVYRATFPTCGPRDTDRPSRRFFLDLIRVQ